MGKKITAVITIASLLLLFPIASHAKNISVKPTGTQTPTPVVESNVNSFDLFWPMVAGRTMQSKIYFLKTLKEKVRGFLIFGSTQKANYDIFLGIKRMLEAESLIKSNLPDLARKTLDRAASEFSSANSALENAKNSRDSLQETKDEINTRLEKLKKFTRFMIKEYPDYKESLDNIQNKLNSITI